ncbi:MAG: ATP-binding protein [Desulfovibrionaceae bacterium]|nr:ATP-binding protein [Desulfovibrionaceae bacterium]
MNSGFSFRNRLVLAFWAVLFLALLGPALYFGHRIKSEVREEAVQEVARQLRALDWTLGHAGGARDLRWLDATIKGLAARLDMRITYIADGGQVLADSAFSLDRVGELENHAARPEVLEARRAPMGASLRYSASVGGELIYAARSTSGYGRVPPGVLRIAKPFTRVTALVDRAGGHLLAVLAASFLVAAILVALVIKTMTDGVRGMVKVAMDIGEGGLDKRITTVPGREFAPLVKAFNGMAERIQANIATITRQKSESEAILNGMRAGVMVLNAEGRIVRTNPALEEMFPAAPAYVGKTPLEATLEPELQQACEEVLKNGQEGLFSQRRVQLRSDSDRHYEVSLVPVPGEGFAGAIVVFHDISEIKRLANVRRDFVANVSHELRTPLTSIKGYAETMLDSGEQFSGNARSFLEVIRKNADHMDRMLDDLLQLSRIESGKARMSLEPMDAANAFRSAEKGLAALAAERGVAVVGDFPAQRPKVLADFDQLVQVFRNLLENAVKYAPQGRGRVEVRAEVRGDDLVVAVDDNGPGIAPEHLDRVFERFYRVDKGARGRPAGTGLGLAICRHILKNHNGSIQARSPVPGRDGGTRFEFSLPLARASADQTKAT